MASPDPGEGSTDGACPDLPNPLRLLSRLNGWLSGAVAVLIGLLLLAMAGVMLLAVYRRYVVGSSLIWSEEATRYLAVWLVFLGVGVAHRFGGHVRIGLLPQRLEGRAQAVTEFAVEAVLMLLVATMAWFGLDIALNNFERGQTSPAMGVPIGAVYLAVPIGMALMLLQGIERLMVLGHAIVTGRPVSALDLFARPDTIAQFARGRR